MDSECNLFRMQSTKITFSKQKHFCEKVLKNVYNFCVVSAIVWWPILATFHWEMSKNIFKNLHKWQINMGILCFLFFSVFEQIKVFNKRENLKITSWENGFDPWVRSLLKSALVAYTIYSIVTNHYLFFSCILNLDVPSQLKFFM